MRRKTGCRLAVLGMAAVSVLLAACGAADRGSQRMSGKEECTLEIEDDIRVICGGTEYVLLNETAPKEEVGTWVGYIQKLVGIGETGEAVFTESIPAGPDDFKDPDREAAYVISFLNVYQLKDEEDVLLVDMNGNYQKAVEAETIHDGQETLLVAELADFNAAAGKFQVNQDDATQLLCGDAVYQVTDELIPEDELGSYLDCIAQRVVFDSDTKEVLTSEELGRIDWSGEEEAKHARTVWFYTDVYEVQGADKTSMVAVRVNGDYRAARR